MKWYVSAMIMLIAACSLGIFIGNWVTMKVLATPSSRVAVPETVVCSCPGSDEEVTPTVPAKPLPKLRVGQLIALPGALWIENVRPDEAHGETYRDPCALDGSRTVTVVGLMSERSVLVRYNKVGEGRGTECAGGTVGILDVVDLADATTRKEREERERAQIDALLKAVK